MGLVTLRFDRGSLLLTGAEGPPWPDPALVWDERVGAWRCLALHYRALVRHLTQAGVPFEDRARAYPQLESVRQPGEPYPYQQEALQAWLPSKRGVVELPTGAGKTRLALLAMAQVRRATLILVPTLELVAQWGEVIERELGLVPGLVGGGEFTVAPVTVCTYASAWRHAERFGDRFGLAVFDECHHLPGEGYAHCAEVLIAPYRLGLTATLERPDQRHALLQGLIGPLVFRKSIPELTGTYLADYEVRVLHAELSAHEREQYQQARRQYRDFVDGLGMSLGSPRAWQRFVFAASRTAEGREALAAYHRQRHLSFAAEDKFQVLQGLLHRHRGRQVLVFTHDLRTATEVSRRFLVPLITHQTPLAERREILGHFRARRWPFLVTSKVLNEGVDVPQVSVAVILSGSASVREHVQRLGRILRRDGAKRAVLYEVLTRDTAERSTSERRRQHDAYR